MTSHGLQVRIQIGRCRSVSHAAMTPRKRSVIVVGRFVKRQQLVSDEVIEQRLGVD